LVALDAYRGFIMLLLASAGFGLAAVAKAKPDSIWPQIAAQFKHVPWQGCAFWDLIQPAFMFMVGVAIPYSYAARRSRGASYIGVLFHALVRSILLIALGVFLASHSQHSTNFLFTNVLAQIGLGYFFVFLLVNRWKWLQGLALVAILGGYWFLFYHHPLPGPDFDWAKAEVQPEERFEGVQAHWSKNVNFAAEQDRKLLNQFPREKPHEFTGGGYQTLNFVPSMATMLLGLMIGELLRSGRSPRAKLLWLLGIGAVCLAAGLGLGYTVCPIVKRIWTPSWTLFSGGLVIWMLAAFYFVIDVVGLRFLALPLAIVGMNSIVIYMMSQLLQGWVATNLKTHFGRYGQMGKDWAGQHLTGPFGQDLAHGIYDPVVISLSVMLVFWIICFWLYRQKIFVRL
jgi:predicted acyltransferase